MIWLAMARWQFNASAVRMVSLSINSFSRLGTAVISLDPWLDQRHAWLATPDADHVQD
jgi:hypothetical protein